MLQNNAIRTICELRSRDSALETMKQFDILLLTLLRLIQTCKTVRRLATTAESLFPRHFQTTSTHNTTRNMDGYSFRLPRSARRMTQRTVFYLGVKMYNELPLDIRSTRKKGVRK